MKARLKQLEKKISKLIPDFPRPENLRLMPFSLLGCVFPGPIILEVDSFLAGQGAPVVFLWCKETGLKGRGRTDCKECEFNRYDEACRLIQEGRQEEVLKENPLVVEVKEINPHRWRLTICRASA